MKFAKRALLGNILDIMNHRQWLEIGLSGLTASKAQRVRVFRLLLASASRLRLEMDRRLADSGITTQQAAVLQWVESQAEPPTLSATACALGMTHQNLKQIASAIERKGLLVIEIDPLDRRGKRLKLTAQHARLWARRNPADFDEVARWTRSLSSSEIDALLAMLEKLNRSLDRLD
jgi:DNA-binding MarR family transcriptional regulator